MARTATRTATPRPEDSSSLDIVILGLAITSAWGNGHATTYRALVQALVRRGHRVLFLERNRPWYAENRDLPHPPYGETVVYDAPEELRTFAPRIAAADLVIVGSYVPDALQIIELVQRVATGVTAFYDIDTPVTLAKLRRGDFEYLRPDLVPGFDLYLSFTGGPMLGVLERELGARRALPLYCSVDQALYAPDPSARLVWDLGYLGTYSDDRQPTLDRLLVDPARRLPRGKFLVVGPMYPDTIVWPANVVRFMHLAPLRHRAFYTSQRFTLNVTRDDMRRAGWSPSVRLFEAAACGTPIISDWWEGLDSFFEPGREILVAETARDTLRILAETGEEERRGIGERARARVLARDTADCRAAELEGYVRSTVARAASGAA